MNRLGLFALLIGAGIALGQSPSSEKPIRYPDVKAHAPTPIPDRLVLTWSGDPATTQAVTWRTDTTVRKSLGQIAAATEGPEFDPRLGLNPAVDVKLVTTLPAIITYLNTDLGPAHYHSVEFTGLKPSTKYVYRAGDGANWSEWNLFRTASEKWEPFGFIYFGDSQNDLKRHWSRVARGAYSAMPDARFIVHAGDLIDNSALDLQWGEWHAAAGWINAVVPNVPTPGNHEYGPKPLNFEQEQHYSLLALTGGTAADPTVPKPPGGNSVHWRPTFTLPPHGPAGLEETVYYLDYQGVRIVSLNSNEKLKEQIPWLENALANNPNRWTVITFHHPIYSPAKNRDNPQVRELWRPIFDKYGVDLVLTGHDHTYGRTGLMRDNETITGNKVYSHSGTVYCVSVSGPKLYDLNESPLMFSKVEKKQLYQLIRIDGAKLHYEARTATGELFDEFELRKQSNRRNELVERASLDSERASANGRGMNGRDALFAVGGMVLLAIGFLVIRRVYRKRQTAPRI